MTDVQTSSSDPRIALGLARFHELDRSQQRDLLQCAWAAGLRWLDTAAIYGSVAGESVRLLGEVLSEPSLRECRFSVSLKIGRIRGLGYSSDAELIRSQIDHARRVLRRDQLDLVFLHGPDRTRDPAEVGGVLQDLLTRGIASAVGLSNHSWADVEVLLGRSGLDATAIQVQIGPRDWSSLLAPWPATRAAGSIFAWDVLGAGLINQREWLHSPAGRVLAMEAHERDLSVAQVLVKLITALEPRVIPIIGTRRTEHLREVALAMAESLSRDDARLILDRVQSANG